MHSRRALEHCAQMGRSSLHLSCGATWSVFSCGFPLGLSLAMWSMGDWRIVYLPLTASEATMDRKVSRSRCSTAACLANQGQAESNIPSSPRARRHDRHFFVSSILENRGWSSRAGTCKNDGVSNGSLAPRTISYSANREISLHAL